MFLNMKEQKDTLIKLVTEKEAQIRKLQQELQIARLYAPIEKKKLSFDLDIRPSTAYYHAERDLNDMKSTSMTELRNKLNTVSNPSLKSSEGTMTSNEELEQLNYNLQKIKINSIIKGK